MKCAEAGPFFRGDTKAILITGDRRMQTAVAAMRVGVVDLVQKASTFDELKSSVVAALERALTRGSPEVVEVQGGGVEVTQMLLGQSGRFAEFSSVVGCHLAGRWGHPFSSTWGQGNGLRDWAHDARDRGSRHLPRSSACDQRSGERFSGSCPHRHPCTGGGDPEEQAQRLRRRLRGEGVRVGGVFGGGSSGSSLGLSLGR